MNNILILKFKLNKKTGQYTHVWKSYDEPKLKEFDVYKILVDEDTLNYETHMIQNGIDVVIDPKYSLTDYINYKIESLEEEYKNKK
jgi:hypothetical protein